MYLVSDAAGRPIYVGQSRNLYNRLAQHTRESSSHVSGSFAFNIAKREAVGLGIDIVGFREELDARDDFNEHFSPRSTWSRRCRSSMAVEEHAGVRTVFEV